MARNGSGVYSPPGASFPAVASTLIEATKFNNVINDIATALTGSIAADGQTTISANLPMSGFKHTGVADGSARSHYASVGQTQDSTTQWAGTAGGTADALELTVTPAITAYAAGQTFRFKAGSSANTGAATVSVSTLTAKAIQNDGAALTAGAIEANKWYEIVYDGTAFQLRKIGYTTTTLKSNSTATLTVGYSNTPYSAGTKSSGTFTPDEANGGFQYYTNGGAHTLAPPTNNCTLVIQITNNASAGAITTSGFTKVIGTTPTTTTGDDFLAFITKINGFSLLQWQALQ